MLCPICKKHLDTAILSGVEVNFCPKCLGLWFEEEELRLSKDYRDGNLRWLDIDLWLDEEKFKISPGQKLCPWDRLPLYETEYPDFIEDPRWLRHRDGDSGIHPVKSAKGGAEQFNGVKVDVCNLCQGIWLDRGEFKKIIQYLKKRADKEVLSHYLKNLKEELWEIFSGPETFREEIDDFLMILKLLNYKFAVQYPSITKIISNLPR